MERINQIQEQNPEAADLISLMSILDRQGIPESLLFQYNSDELSLSNALGTLLAYSLIKTDMEGKKLEDRSIFSICMNGEIEEVPKLSHYSFLQHAC